MTGEHAWWVIQTPPPPPLPLSPWTVVLLLPLLMQLLP